MLLLLTSCQREKDIEIEFPYHGDELVIYAFINDSVQYAEVYKTQEVLQTEIDYSVVPTRLELYEGNNLVSSLDENQNNFMSNAILDTLSFFQVELEVNDQITTSAPVSFPDKIKIENYDVEFNSDSSKVLLTFSFNDEKGDNFYLFKVDKYYQNQIENTFDNLFYEDFRYTFSDIEFSEETFFYEEEIDLSFIQYLNGNIIGIEKADAISITLYSVSSEIYDYYQSVQQNSSSLGDVEDSNTPIITNINNGHGVVGAYRKDFIFIDL